jgi:GNAT superfamily N-acetyltransferase
MVTYRLATEADYVSINNFHNRIYKSNRTIEQFYWEFHDCPFGASVYVVAVDGQKIVGTNCVIPIMLTNERQENILTGKSEDTLVDPDYRGQNIFNNIYDFLYDRCRDRGIKVIWGYTSAKKPFEKIGFSVPFDHQQSLMVNNIGESYQYLSRLNDKNTVSKKIQIFGLCVISKTKSIFSMLNVKKPNFKIVVNNKILDQVDGLIKSNAQAGNDIFYINQTPDFNQWRFYNNPNFYKTHTFGFYDNEGELRALILLNSHPNRIAYINQCYFDQSISEKERSEILKWASRQLFKEKIALIRNWHFNTNTINIDEMNTHKLAGFISLNKGIGFVWKELVETDLNPKNFYLNRVSTQGVI